MQKMRKVWFAGRREGKRKPLNIGSAQSPKKAGNKPRTRNSIGKPLLGPPFVLVDIVFGDQIDRNKCQLLIRFFTIENIAANVDSFFRH
jgi:hypothetical protein